MSRCKHADIFYSTSSWLTACSSVTAAKDLSGVCRPFFFTFIRSVHVNKCMVYTKIYKGLYKKYNYCYIFHTYCSIRCVFFQRSEVKHHLLKSLITKVKAHIQLNSTCYTVVNGKVYFWGIFISCILEN